MSSNRPNLTLDEHAFEGLLSAAFTIQEHNDRQKEAQPSAVTGAEASTLCRHCGALKPSDTSPCGTCGLEEFRPGERLQRNWASMWLHSQYQMQWPEPPADAGVEGYIRRFADTAKDMAAENLRLAMNDANSVGASTPLSLTVDATPLAKFESTFSALEPTFEANCDPHFDPIIAAADPLPVSLFHRLSGWRVKLRFQRADLYLGLAVFVSATALLWPAAVPPRPESLNSWERALVMLGIAEAPAPLVHLQGDPAIQVWIDPHTALYYCPGDEQYEKTDGGRLSSQSEAQTDRFEPASRSACE